jgi:hypothetical protein
MRFRYRASTNISNSMNGRGRALETVYVSGQGGGARIVDKFGDAREEESTAAPENPPAQKQGSAVPLQVKKWKQLKLRPKLS